MRLDSVLDSFYALNSLWGALMGPQVCPSIQGDLSRAARAAVWAPPPSAEVTAFVNVNVIPMDRERVLPNHTVLVERGRITALGPTSRVPVPATAVRIDGRGKYLMPGLGDMHVHDLELGDIRGDTREEIAGLAFGFLADGVTTVRHMHEEDTIVHVDGHSSYFPGRVSRAQLDMIRVGEILSPRVYASGIQLGNPASIGVPQKNSPPDGKAQAPDGNQILSLDSAMAIVTAAKAAGYPIVHVATKDVYARRSFPIVDAVLVAAQRLGLKLAAHDHDRSFGKVLALGAWGGATEHLEWLRDTLGLPPENYSDPLTPQEKAAIAAELPALAARAADARVWVTPTLNCLEMRYVMSDDQRVLLRQMVKALHDAGVGLLLAGDDHKNVHSDLVALVRAGLTPYQALRTGTYNVADYLGVLDSSGTVAVGKWADLVLLNGNPLRDIRRTREPAGVMVGGRWLDREALDRGLLALPRHGKAQSWIRRSVLATGINPQPSREVQQPKLGVHVTRFEDLTDSLNATLAKGGDGGPAARRVRQLMMKEFQAMRAILRREQYETFDTHVRLWQREQARQSRRTMARVGATAP